MQSTVDAVVGSRHGLGLRWTPLPCGGGYGDLAVIDFDHSRRDLAARDLVRLATRTWPQRPDLEEAFLRGCGPLSDLDRQIIDHCAHLDALTAIARTYMKALATGQLSGRS